jgi:hypothetical protein
MASSLSRFRDDGARAGAGSVAGFPMAALERAAPASRSLDGGGVVSRTDTDGGAGVKNARERTDGRMARTTSMPTTSRAELSRDAHFFVAA